MSTCTDCGQSPCVGRSLCKSDYYKRRRRGTLPPMIPGGFAERRIRGTCGVPGCGKPHEALGYCGTHYKRLVTTGSVEDPRATMADADRLWAQAERAADGSGCLLWTSATTNSGYPQVWWQGKTEGAHRIAYRLAVDEIPPGYDVDHVQDSGCCHTECIEPAHLEAVTKTENQQRKKFTAEQRARCADGGRKSRKSRKGEDPVARFWAHGERAKDGSGCLLWTLYVSKKTGYGQVRWQGATQLVHRVAWELANKRPVPEGHDVDHVRARGCRHKHCIEPAHLEAVPMAVNRGRRAHPAVLRELPPENPRGPGRRRQASAVQGGATKNDPAVVAAWKELITAGWSQARVGREYGVSQMTVSRAVRDSR
jgi:hypothetical protein